MRDGSRAWFGAVAIACAASSAFAAETPDPAMLEFLGAAARVEASGVDVDRLVDERLANDDRLNDGGWAGNDESVESDE